VRYAKPRALKLPNWRALSSYLELIENGTRQPDAAIRRSLAWELGVPGWRGEP